MVWPMTNDGRVAQFTWCQTTVATVVDCIPDWKSETVDCTKKETWSATVFWCGDKKWSATMLCHINTSWSATMICNHADSQSVTVNLTPTGHDRRQWFLKVTKYCPKTWYICGAECALGRGWADCSSLLSAVARLVSGSTGLKMAPWRGIALVVGAWPNATDERFGTLVRGRNDSLQSAR